jgi:hypothetical protein
MYHTPVIRAFISIENRHTGKSVSFNEEIEALSAACVLARTRMSENSAGYIRFDAL